MATQRREAAAGAEFANALRAEIDSMREESGAEIVVLYPYDDAAGTFYAPTAVGLPESDLVASLPDMVDQLARFRADEAQGKIADEVSPASYGPSAWLLATLRPLVTADPAHD